MIPNKLQDWTIETVRTLLEKGIYESDAFDFKLTLPAKDDSTGKDRLRRVCCAFANSQGGFIIFGVSDEKGVSIEQRIQGMNYDPEFPSKFGDFPANCFPSIDWEPRHEPLRLSSGKVLNIIEIPKSWRAPHASKDKNSNGYRFSKRTNKGDEDMSIEEIRGAFLGFYEKRIKLQLLRAELTSVQNKSVSLIQWIDSPSRKELEYNLTTFDATIIETVISDTYSMTANNQPLLATIFELRDVLNNTNTKNRIFFGIIEFPFNDKKYRIIQHYESMKEYCKQMIILAKKAIDLLDELLA